MKMHIKLGVSPYLTQFVLNYIVVRVTKERATFFKRPYLSNHSTFFSWKLAKFAKFRALWKAHPTSGSKNMFAQKNVTRPLVTRTTICTRKLFVANKLSLIQILHWSLDKNAVKFSSPFYLLASYTEIKKNE